MQPFVYTLLDMTALVAALVGVLAYAVLRFLGAMRALRRQTRGGDERVFMATALQDAVTRLKTQERAMTERAEESERLSDEIMASLTSGLIVVGLEGLVRVVNPSAARLLGIAETPGLPYRQVLTSAEPLADVIGNCLRAGHGVPRQTVALVRPDTGEPLHLGVSVSALRDGKGTLRGAICLFNDITAVVSLEEQLRLKDGLARLGELTAGLAHEFRNSLGTIHGYARMIDPEKVPAEYRAYVQGIRDETDVLGQIVTNFLAFARPASPAHGRLDLRAVVESAVEDIRDEVSARGGTVSLEGPFGAVNGDQVMLRQAISNLLRNALEACEQAGVAPSVRISGAVDAGRGVVRLSVADNGGGVPASIRHRLFNPFFTTKPHGTGLGLALVQKIIVTHDGRISLVSPPGAAACFLVELPLANPDELPQP